MVMLIAIITISIPGQVATGGVYMQAPPFLLPSQTTIMLLRTNHVHDTIERWQNRRSMDAAAGERDMGRQRRRCMRRRDGTTARRGRDAGSLTLREVLKIRAVGCNPHHLGAIVHTPSLALHKRTVLSNAAHAIHWPSGENSAALMIMLVERQDPGAAERVAHLHRRLS